MGFDDRSPGFARQSERPVGMVADLVLAQKAQNICPHNPGLQNKKKKKIQAFRVVTCTVLGG